MVVCAFLLSGYIDVGPSAPRAPAGFFTAERNPERRAQAFVSMRHQVLNSWDPSNRRECSQLP